MTQIEYWEQVRACANEVAGEVAEGDGELVELVEAHVDSHEFITYTHKAIQVLLHSRNDDAIFEELGDQSWANAAAAFTAMAYWAMRADIIEELERRK